MGETQSTGTCCLCGQKFSRRAMSKHLQKCRIESADKVGDPKGKAKVQGPTKTLHLFVQGSPEYWLHLEAAGDATLEQLDQFLRKIWLECCGHCSDFEIEGVAYTPMPSSDYRTEKSLRVALDRVLREGQKFQHTYDYGSTTRLELKVVGTREAAFPARFIQLQARNDPPEILCVDCGAPAVLVCTQCLWDGAGWLCETCAQNHECGDEYCLPVVNSPRCGVCGYTGEDKIAGPGRTRRGYSRSRRHWVWGRVDHAPFSQAHETTK